MPNFTEYMRALAKETQWAALRNPDPDKGCFVALEDDVDLLFATRGPGVVLLKSELCQMPEDSVVRDGILKRVGQFMVGVRRQRRTQLSLEGDSFVAFRLVDTMTSIPVFLRLVTDWVNDVVWWKKAVAQAVLLEQKSEPESMTSLFSNSFVGIRL
ncbi:MAG: hypothetical protein IJU76_07110 [Desulfovibrionaceae bacterium]|nr:hypothetical protein [Desulfovibrionaceae bacterium]